MLNAKHQQQQLNNNNITSLISPDSSPLLQSKLNSKSKTNKKIQDEYYVENNRKPISLNLSTGSSSSNEDNDYSSTFHQLHNQISLLSQNQVFSDLKRSITDNNTTQNSLNNLKSGNLTKSTESVPSPNNDNNNNSNNSSSNSSLNNSNTNITNNNSNNNSNSSSPSNKRLNIKKSFKESILDHTSTLNETSFNQPIESRIESSDYLESLITNLRNKDLNKINNSNNNSNDNSNNSNNSNKKKRSFDNIDSATTTPTTPSTSTTTPSNNTIKQQQQLTNDQNDLQGTIQNQKRLINEQKEYIIILQKEIDNLKSDHNSFKKRMASSLNELLLIVDNHKPTTNNNN
ncbi:hypothetical protein CYY_004652 [Polysphondylium violaceum]|uniref:Uncharacterized protein n=1 Tax=Polysphondylium violaceum TaxID=133409 RepID=A0A8J4V079_9MYCE|nr:hypothetical protein CYY_004652 [Polysphondylium violaceum]